MTRGLERLPTNQMFMGLLIYWKILLLQYVLTYDLYCAAMATNMLRNKKGCDWKSPGQDVDAYVYMLFLSPRKDCVFTWKSFLSSSALAMACAASTPTVFPSNLKACKPSNSRIAFTISSASGREREGETISGQIMRWQKGTKTRLLN